MRWHRPVLWALGLAGCGYSPEKFNEDYAAAWCDFAVSCGLVDDTTEACVAEVGDYADADCAFDAAAGRDCVDGFRDLPCPELGTFELPVACNYVCGAGDSGTN